MGPLAKIVVVGLFIMSAYSIGVMIDRLMAYSAARKQSRAFAPAVAGALREGKGGILGNLHTFPSTMAQNFWVAIMGFVVCVVVTTIVSLATTPRTDQEMEGLVYLSLIHI